MRSALLASRATTFSSMARCTASSVSSNFNQGTIEVTGLDLDLAIQGEALPNAGGFFEIADPLTGELFYTRAGAFESDNAGFVVTRDQYRYQLQGIDNAVTVGVPNPETQSLLARRVEEDGVINVVVHDKELNKDIVTPVSQVKVVNFLLRNILGELGTAFIPMVGRVRILPAFQVIMFRPLVPTANSSNTPWSCLTST